VREGEKQRDRVMRALCFLISEIAETVHLRDALSKEWHRDPFLFREFRAGVAKLLDELAPPDDARPPPLPAGRHPRLRDDFIADPMASGVRAADTLLGALYQRGLAPGQLRALLQLIKDPGVRDNMEDLFYDMSSARRDLGIDEPKETKQ
jgi:hypothetical protein